MPSRLLSYLSSVIHEGSARQLLPSLYSRYCYNSHLILLIFFFSLLHFFFFFKKTSPGPFQNGEKKQKSKAVKIGCTQYSRCRTTVNLYKAYIIPIHFQKRRNEWKMTPSKAVKTQGGSLGSFRKPSGRRQWRSECSMS